MRPVTQLLLEAREAITPALRDIVDGLPDTLRRVAGYHIGWWDAEGRPISGTGKAIRPALTLACARATGGTATPGVLDAAAAVELVHDFSLLHDDVMDNDTTRRHRPSAWSVFGVDQAILTGDMLLTAAIRRLCDTDLAPVLADAVLELGTGQCADLAFEDASEVSLAECLAMAEGKTGAILGTACELGARAAGATAQAASGYRTFGRQLGVAFQIVDDALSIWGDPLRTGKPIGNDLAARKKSLPVAAALLSDTAAGRELAQVFATTDEFDQTTTARAAELVEQAGGRTWAAAEVDRRIGSALRALADLGPTPDGGAELRAIAALVTNRDH
ncbi:polyprenyl synthetase family protein [Kitasatospora kifunensis]|uniref:Geranylgeranyl diphosphate synthase type I n=1 Tax=Kitasatospora kifunensis TaxID=58351 RepID=A0A7W7R6M8_KITKI|nr:polyprenyl synthetase family protein [Kitasatospora kifunensis]MBB4926334.1 geranylgeranyl diphosphate synthase type I [Kitasatospora kifunensis]